MPPRTLRPLLALAIAGILATMPATQSTAQTETRPYVTLEGRALLPADTFAAGPPSGCPTCGGNGRTVPFPGQVVQGFSAVLPKWNGNYVVLADNGFGNAANSSTFRLRWYEVDPDFEAGSVEVVGYTELTDPNRLVPFPIVNGDVDRALTGNDFDPESFRQAPDGSFWYGDEFGPYLLHTDSAGRLLDAPIPTPIPAALAPFARGLPFVQAPENPAFRGLPNADAQRAAANLPSSRGFEGMAINPDGTRLYPILEGALNDDPVRTRRLMQEFDIGTKQYTGNYWFYPMTNASYAIGDMTAIGDRSFIVIERDNEQGDRSRFKRIFRIDLDSVGPDGTLNKTLVADLLEITDRREITQAEQGTFGLGQPFRFPFITIESVYPVDSRTLLVINDNNYPGSSGRRAGQPDDNEFILIRLPEPLED